MSSGTATFTNTVQPSARRLSPLLLKIFGAFWLAMVAVLIVKDIVTFTLYERFNSAQIESRRQSDVDVVATAAAGLIDARGQEALVPWLQRINRDQQPRRHYYLVEASGQEALGQALPQEIDVWLRDAAVAAPQNTVMSRVPTQTGVLTVVMTYTRPPRSSLMWLQPYSTWGWLLGMVVSAVVCFLLARNISLPITSLRNAARRIAGGDLSVRVRPRLGTRLDEFAQLGEDFDGMTARIEALMDAQRQLLRDVSHELCSPLSRLRVAVALARDTDGGDETLLARIDDECQRMNDLLQNILTWNRLESGIVIGPSDRVDVTALLRQVVADANFESGGDSDGDGGRVRLNATLNAVIPGSMALLRSAVENVVRNAIRHSLHGAAVEVSVHERMLEARPQLLITVRDYGPGVPEPALGRIFQPFVRLSESRDPGGGYGLGLAIAERAVRAHGGAIAVRNAIGGGLLVEIALPVARA